MDMWAQLSSQGVRGVRTGGLMGHAPWETSFRALSPLTQQLQSSFGDEITSLLIF